MATAAFLALATTCAPGVDKTTSLMVSQVESGNLNPLALNVNRWRGPQPQARTVGEAADIARHYISLGYSVDLGAMQVNSRNLPGFGYSYAQIEQVLDPCTNISIGGAILSDAYGRARRKGYASGQPALMVALSIYNTGNEEGGFSNGYVRKYYDRVPGLDSLNTSSRTAIVQPIQARTPAAGPQRPRNIYAADPQVFWSE